MFPSVPLLICEHDVIGECGQFVGFSMPSMRTLPLSRLSNYAIGIPVPLARSRMRSPPANCMFASGNAKSASRRYTSSASIPRNALVRCEQCRDSAHYCSAWYCLGLCPCVLAALQRIIAFPDTECFPNLGLPTIEAAIGSELTTAPLFEPVQIIDRSATISLSHLAVDFSKPTRRNKALNGRRSDPYSGPIA